MNFRSCITVFGLLLSSLTACAQSTTFTYQGQLRQNNAPVNDGAVTMSFHLYDAASGGNLIVGPLIATVAVQNGLFTVPLDFGAGSFNGQRRWLQVTIGSTTLSPRQEVTPAPYSIFSANTRGLSVDGSGNIGIPDVKTLEFGLGAANKQVDAGKIGYQRFSTGLDIIGAGTNASNRKITFWNEGGASFTGNVGIGASVPGFPLSFPNTLGDKIALWGESDAHFGFGIQSSLLQIHTAANGDDIAFGYGSSASFIETMRIKGNGKVGIGTSNPQVQLHVITDNGQLAAINGVSVTVDGTGIFGEANNGSLAYGVWGKSTSGYAGYFNGKVHVSGTLSKSGGSFKIDHPLDPENKTLTHSFVESPDMMNVYNGNIVTNDKGEAWVELPAYFEALNRDFRYQLTVIGQFAQAIVGQKIVGNHFLIRTDKPNVEVSWQVTGIRKDPWAEKNRIISEEDKPDWMRGKFLNPEAYDQPAEQGAFNKQLPTPLEPNKKAAKQ